MVEELRCQWDGEASQGLAALGMERQKTGGGLLAEPSSQDHVEGAEARRDCPAGAAPGKGAD